MTLGYAIRRFGMGCLEFPLILLRSVGTCVLYGGFIIGTVIMGVPFYGALVLLVRNRAKRRNILRNTVRMTNRIFIAAGAILGCFRVKSDDLCNISSLRGAIIIANHPSLIDALILTSRFGPSACVMVKKSLLNGFMRSLILNLGYVSNESPFEDLQQKLADGDSLILFPEGTRTKNYEKMSFHRGAANLACRLDLPIYPIFIDCSDRNYLNKGFFSCRAPNKVPIYNVVCGNLINWREIAEDGDSAPLAARKLNRYLEELYEQRLSGTEGSNDAEQ